MPNGSLDSNRYSRYRYLAICGRSSLVGTLMTSYTTTSGSGCGGYLVILQLITVKHNASFSVPSCILLQLVSVSSFM